jgi:hypothetical protein
MVFILLLRFGGSFGARICFASRIWGKHHIFTIPGHGQEQPVKQACIRPKQAKGELKPF